MTISNVGPQFTGKTADEMAPGSDRLRKVVHALLAIYLLPALALVLIVGGGLLAVSMVARGMACVAGFAGRNSAATTYATGDESAAEWARGPVAPTAVLPGRRSAVHGRRA